MKRKTMLAFVCGTVMMALVACGTDTASVQSDNTNSSYSDNQSYNSSSNSTSSSTSSSSSSSSSSYNSSSSSSSIEHYCDASGCTKEGTYKEVGFGGDYEYYCYDHYKEIQDMIGSMEQDVGSGSASKHTCEECSKEGTHSIEGFSGQTEYYCTEHYNQLIDLLSGMLGDE